jgi:hypothetical protein
VAALAALWFRRYRLARIAAIGLAFGGLVLAPSLFYLFKVFKSGPADGQSRYDGTH